MSSVKFEKEIDRSKKCLIVSGGDYAEIDEPVPAFDYIIACDKGFINASSLDITPDIIIGDFDSYLEEITHIPVLKLPAVKDDTDTMAAVKYALEKGYLDITICCAFGGRLDHSIANIQTGAYIVSQGGRAAVLGADTYSYVFSNDSVSLERKKGFTLSVFALTDKCENVSIEGTFYTLESEEVTNSFPLGVSNTWMEETAAVSVGDGILAVIMSKDN